MKFAVYGDSGRVAAVMADGNLVDLELAQREFSALKGSGYVTPKDLLSFVLGGEGALETAKEILSYIEGHREARKKLTDVGVILDSNEVRLRTTLPSPISKIACSGQNYIDHAAANSSQIRHKAVTEEEVAKDTLSKPPWGFWKLSHCVIGPGDTVIMPDKNAYLDFECELAAIVGKPIKRMTAAQARDRIWGYTILNDFSWRDLSEPGRYNWALGKNFDTSCAMGPYVVTSDEIPDTRRTVLRTRVNGELRQNGDSSKMIRDIPELLSHLSNHITFQPGDILSGGTCAGTAMDSTKRDSEGRFVDRKLFLKTGDLVEAEIAPIGVLRNVVK